MKTLCVVLMSSYLLYLATQTNPKYKRTRGAILLASFVVMLVAIILFWFE